MDIALLETAQKDNRGDDEYGGAAQKEEEEKHGEAVKGGVVGGGDGHTVNDTGASSGCTGRSQQDTRD